MNRLYVKVLLLQKPAIVNAASSVVLQSTINPYRLPKA